MANLKHGTTIGGYLAFHSGNSIWSEARTLTLTGGVIGNVSFDGSGNITLDTTVSDNSHSHTSAFISDATDINTSNTIVKRNASGNFSASVITTSGILPNEASTVDLGSVLMPFREIHTDELFLSANSLYVNDKKVIQDDSSTMTFSTDVDQDLKIKTTGLGDINLVSENTVTTQGNGGLIYNVPSTYSSKNIDFNNYSVGGAVSFYSVSNILLTSPSVTTSGSISWLDGSSTNANTAYGWGDHSTQGYLVSSDLSSISNVAYLNKNNIFTGVNTHSSNIISNNFSLLQNFLIDLNPESLTTILPCVTNDLAYLIQRGGSVTTNSPYTNVTNFFDGSPKYLVMNVDTLNALENGQLIFEIDFGKVFRYGSKIGVSFGNTTWRAKYIKMEMFDVAADEWQTKVTYTDNTSSIVVKSIGTGGSGFSKMRMTFKDYNNLSQFRINQIFLLNYNSSLLKETYVGRDGGAIYGDLNLTGSLTVPGGSSTQWNTAYNWGDHSTQGYLTEHQSLEGYATETFVTDKNYLTTHQDLSAYALSSSLFSGSYNDLTDKPIEVDLNGYATEGFVGTAITNLIDSSPDTLDTLNELANALNDDPNFATTVSSSIGTKLSKTSNLSDLTNKATALSNLGALAVGANAVSATKLNTARTISLSGDVTGSVSFDGSANVSLTATVGNDTHTHDNRYYTKTESDAKYANSYSSIISTNNSAYVNLCNVNGNSLSSQVRLTVRGTATRVVVSSIIDIVVNHSNNISIKSQSGNYTVLYINVISNGNEDFSIQLKTNSPNSVNLYCEVYPLNGEVITFSPTASYSTKSHEHTCSSGTSLSGTNSHNVNVNGDITATTSMTAPTFNGALSGNASTATKLATTRTISLSGDVTGSVSFDGSANVSLTATVGNDTHTHTDRANGFRGSGSTGSSSLLWYRIGYATGGSPASAIFTVRGTRSSHHTIVTFSASCAYGQDPCITLLGKSTYGYHGIHAIRIESQSTHDQFDVMVQADASSIIWEVTNSIGFVEGWATNVTADRVGTQITVTDTSKSIDTKGGYVYSNGSKTSIEGHTHSEYLTSHQSLSSRALLAGSLSQDFSADTLNVDNGVNLTGGVYSNSSADSYDKVRVYTNSEYTIGMKSAQTYGGLNDWAMTFTMNNEYDRGFLWRDSSDSASDGAMSLTTGGILTVKSNTTIGGKIYANGSIRLGTNKYISFDGSDTYYMRESNGNYGSVSVFGAKSTWGGYSIADQYVFMADATHAGIYNDINNEWMWLANQNGDSMMYCNGSEKIKAYSTGAYISGQLTASGDITAFSDIRVKDNIHTLTNALDNVNNLRGVSFTRTDQEDKERIHIGVIAQELEEYYPELVTTMSDEIGTKTVNYAQLTGVLIEAIKELSVKINKLENK